MLKTHTHVRQQLTRVCFDKAFTRVTWILIKVQSTSSFISLKAGRAQTKVILNPPYLLNGLTQLADDVMMWINGGERTIQPKRPWAKNLE